MLLLILLTQLILSVRRNAVTMVMLVSITLRIITPLLSTNQHLHESRRNYTEEKILRKRLIMVRLQNMADMIVVMFCLRYYSVGTVDPIIKGNTGKMGIMRHITCGARD